MMLASCFGNSEKISKLIPTINRSQVQPDLATGCDWLLRNDVFFILFYFVCVRTNDLLIDMPASWTPHPRWASICALILFYRFVVSLLTDHFESQKEYLRADEYNRLLLQVLREDFQDDILRHSLLAYRQLKSVEVIIHCQIIGAALLDLNSYSREILFICSFIRSWHCIRRCHQARCCTLSSSMHTWTRINWGSPTIWSWRWQKKILEFRWAR